MASTPTTSKRVGSTREATATESASPHLPASDGPSNFIRDIIDQDRRANLHEGRVVTRFPPEPNGYLHIGHAKAICIDFGVGGGIEGHKCHLRFDDTNPVKEDTEYVEAIQRDIKWLGFDWGEHLYFASDYFERLYQYAESLIEAGLAYVCSLSEAEARQGRGSVTEAGTASPDRQRSIGENLELFRRMRAGEFKDGELVLRARIDMAAANMKLRDPAIYRIRHIAHHRTGTDWCIYPLYDFTHCLSDSIEHVTHSLCTVEFESARELYDWVVQKSGIADPPHQYEFAPLSLTYVVTSKRKLRLLIEEGHVGGWDDPRLPTLSALRRRGYLPEAIRSFIRSLGVSKNRALTDVGRLEAEQRLHLNPVSKRVLAVLDPLKVVITNLAEGESIEIDAPYFPDDVPVAGSRLLAFTRVLFIERSDFMETPSKKFRRLAPGREVRLRHAYVMRCDEVLKDSEGQITELRCSVDLDTLDRSPKDGRKVPGTIHWVSVSHSKPCEVRVFERLFTVEQPDRPDGPPFTDFLNPDSLRTFPKARVEPSVTADAAGVRYQFERLGFFWRDPLDSTSTSLIFNRIVSLKDSWQKIANANVEGQSTEQQTQELRRRERETRQKEQAAADRARPSELGEVAAKLVFAYGLPAAQARVLDANERLLGFFADAVDAFGQTRLSLRKVLELDLVELKAGSPITASQKLTKVVSGLVVVELPKLLKEHSEGPAFDAKGLTELALLIDSGEVSARAAKDVLAEMLRGGAAPATIVETLGLKMLTDNSVLVPIVNDVLAEFASKADAYRAGNKNLLGLFVGQVIRRSGGKADPKVVAALVRASLGG